MKTGKIAIDMKDISPLLFRLREEKRGQTKGGIYHRIQVSHNHMVVKITGIPNVL